MGSLLRRAAVSAHPLILVPRHLAAAGSAPACPSSGYHTRNGPRCGPPPPPPMTESFLGRSALPPRQVLLGPRLLAPAGSAPTSWRGFSSHHPVPENETVWLVARLEPPINWGVNFVPEKYVYVVERFGKYLRTLDSGMHLLIPGVDRITYKYCLKEQIIPILKLKALTNDSFIVKIDSRMYVKVTDPFLASYAIGDTFAAVLQQAEVTMKIEIGKITLSKISEDTASLNEKIMDAINTVAKNWGLKCIRYEINEIILPQGMKQAIDMHIGSVIMESGGTLSGVEIRSKAVAEADQLLASGYIKALVAAKAPMASSGEKAAIQAEDDKCKDQKPARDMSAATLVGGAIGGAGFLPGEKKLLHIMDLGKQAYQRFGWVVKDRRKGKSKMEEPPQKNNTSNDDSRSESDDDANGGDSDGDWWLGY